MSTCEAHGWHSAPFCSACDREVGPNASEAAGYRLFNDDRLLGQNQYASRYINGTHGYPNLGEGFRFKGDTAQYHSIYIHVDDYDAFREKVLAHRNRD